MVFLKKRMIGFTTDNKNTCMKDRLLRGVANAGRCRELREKTGGGEGVEVVAA